MHFGEIPDPRGDTALHEFLEVIFIARAVVLCGARDCTAVAIFARAKVDLLK